MKRTEAYIADNGTLCRSKEEAASVDLRVLFNRDGHDAKIETLRLMVKHRKAVMDILRVVDGPDYLVSTYYPETDAGNPPCEAVA